MIRPLAIILAALALTGCTSPKALPGPDTPPPSIETVLENQHRAVDGLDRLWARCTVRVEGKDAEGNDLREQAEGVLQVIPDHHLSLSLGKLNRTRLALGSNLERYWWLDMIDDADRIAVYGRHALVSPDKTAQMGLPVHPLDLIELTAITPLPDTTVVRGFDPSGHVEIEHPSRWGTRRVSYDPDTWRPTRVQLLDEQGDTVVAADLLAHTRVSIVGDATRTPWVADRIEIRARGFDGLIRMELFDPTNKDIRDAAFDFERLVDQIFKVNRFYDLDRTPDPDEPSEPDPQGAPGDGP